MPFVNTEFVLRWNSPKNNQASPFSSPQQGPELTDILCMLLSFSSTLTALHFIFHSLMICLCPLPLVCLISTLRQNVWNGWIPAVKDVLFCDSRWDRSGSHSIVCSGSLWSSWFYILLSHAQIKTHLGVKQTKERQQISKHLGTHLLLLCICRSLELHFPSCMCTAGRSVCVSLSMCETESVWCTFLTHSAPWFVGCQCWIQSNSLSRLVPSDALPATMSLFSLLWHPTVLLSEQPQEKKQVSTERISHISALLCYFTDTSPNKFLSL